MIRICYPWILDSKRLGVTSEQPRIMCAVTSLRGLDLTSTREGIKLSGSRVVVERGLARVRHKVVTHCLLNEEYDSSGSPNFGKHKSCLIAF
jgi:hypothetical protein